MKQCIARVTIFLLLISVYATALAQNSKPLYKAEFGIAPYTFRKSFQNSIPATLDTIKMMGFTEIEGGGGRMAPEEFKKLCNDRGISIPGTGAGYEQLVNHPDSVVYRAKALGAKYVMTAWIPHKTGSFNFENAKKAVEDFNRVGKILKDNGLTFCYHAHGYEFWPHENGTLLDYIINNTNPEYVSFEMDVFWIQFGGGDPVQLLKKYGNRWKLIHLKDLRKGAKKDLTGLTGPENNVPLGEGELDIPGILKEANKIGIKHFFIEDESDFVITQVPKSIAYLKKLKE
ncbi:MAG TPA: sugar phosphate isomerase/epimerase [Flavitalea sp.]|nr:sugar phosphate isomerase/epimerase [Flavitalea sp.]